MEKENMINGKKEQLQQLLRYERDKSLAKMVQMTKEPESLEKKGIRKGVLGGLAMMAIAVIWFIVGYGAGYIFFYPPILFLIGVYAFFKGIITGNLNGKVKDESQTHPTTQRKMGK